MKAGAVEFLIKPVRRRRAGRRHRARPRPQPPRRWSARRRLSELLDALRSLTPREREVMVLVVSGLLNKQVGGELGISEITVKAHRGQVMRKMKADSLPALVHMVADLGLPSTSIG